MATDLNRCEFIGRLGRDPDTRYSSDGKAIVNFSIAVTRTWTKDGGKAEKTTWVPIVCFGKLGEICAQYLKKGSQVYIAGELNVRKWQGKDGNDRYTTEIVGSELQMLGGRRDSSDARAERPQETESKDESLDDDIPF